MEKKRLMIVEGSFGYGSWLVEMFQMHCRKLNIECDITLAKHASEAMFLLITNRAIPSQKFDCILSNLDLLGLTGIDLVEHVRRVDEEIPFFLMSDWREGPVEKDAIEKGATACFVKSDHTLMDAVCDALKSSSSSQGGAQ